MLGLDRREEDARLGEGKEEDRELEGFLRTLVGRRKRVGESRDREKQQYKHKRRGREKRRKRGVRIA